jgi:hypothetical protein
LNNIKKLKCIIVLVGIIFLGWNTVSVADSVWKIEGELLNRAMLPQAKKSDYPDCNFTGIVNVTKNISKSKISRKIVVVFNGFVKRKYLPTANLKVGDKLIIDLIAFDTLSVKLKSRKMVDDNDNIDLNYYYAKSVKVINTFSKKTSENIIKNSTQKSCTRVFPVNRQQSGSSRKIRVAQIKNNLINIRQAIIRQELINKKLIKVFPTAFMRLGQRAAIPDSGITQNKKLFMTWGNDSFFSLPKNYNPFTKNIWLLWQQTLFSDFSKPALLSLKHYLNYHNVDMLLVLVPDLNDLSCDVLMPEMKNYRNLNQMKQVEKLLLAGIDVLDLTESMQKHKFEYNMLFRYNTGDYHPFSGAVQISAKTVSEYLKKRKYKLPQYNKRATTIVRQPDSSKNSYHKKHNSFSANNGHYEAGKTIPMTFVVKPKKRAIIKPCVLISSNSFNSTPWGGGAFCDFISMQLNTSVEVLSRNGGTPRLPLNIYSKGTALLKGKRICIIYISPAHLANEWYNLKRQNIVKRYKLSKLQYSVTSSLLIKNNTKLNSPNRRFIEKICKNKSVDLLFFPAMNDNAGSVSITINLPDNISAADITGVEFALDAPRMHLPVKFSSFEFNDLYSTYLSMTKPIVVFTNKNLKNNSKILQIDVTAIYHRYVLALKSVTILTDK